MKINDLPQGVITCSTYSESKKTLAFLFQQEDSTPKFFLRKEDESIKELSLPAGFIFSTIVPIPGDHKFLCLAEGPPTPRPSEPLISDRSYLWIVDIETELITKLELKGDWHVTRLMAPAEHAAAVIAVVSSSRRTETMVLVEYHVASISTQTGNVVVLRNNIYPRY